MNAYASGIDQKSYSITVTRGLLDTLNGPELEAVLAHELTHIIDRDCRLLIVTVVFTGMISFLAQMLWRSIYISSWTRGRGRNGGGMIVLLLIAAVAAFVGYLLALILRFALSRRRELLADAGSVELTKNPDALISALMKISQNPNIQHVPSEVRRCSSKTRLRPLACSTRIRLSRSAFIFWSNWAVICRRSNCPRPAPHQRPSNRVHGVHPPQAHRPLRTPAPGVRTAVRQIRAVSELLRS
jgi:Zn-dependent protease with chaperone function